MIDPLRLKKLLQWMIDIYSPSGKEEELLRYLKGYLKRRGLYVKEQPVDGNRYNLICAPHDNDIRLALIGHIDTVSAYDLETFGYAEKGSTIVGLGAADMKGGCAAMIEAFADAAKACAGRLPVALCLVVGEEETGDGAAQLMRQYRFPWALIGEPTGLVPCFGSYGYLETQISASGERRHASLAGRRQNAVETLLERLLAVTHFFEHRHPDLIYNIRDLYTPAAGFAVPEYSEAWIDIHLPPSASTGILISELEEIASDQTTAGVEVLFQARTVDAGYELPERGRVADCLREAFAGQGLSWRTGAFRSHSDANQLFASGVRPIVLGPGHLENAHVPDESIVFQEVVTAAVVYRDFLERFLSGFRAFPWPEAETSSGQAGW